MNARGATSSVDFLRKLREGYDVVMGNRFKGGIMPGAMPFKNRWLGNPVLSGVGRIIYRAPVSDFHSGIRGFTRGPSSQLLKARACRAGRTDVANLFG
jgi:hypothetical protein